MSTVEDIRADLARNDKGNSCQTINNCMLVFHRDPLLKGSIRKNELSGKIDIVGNLGWQRTSSSLTDTDVYQIHWYLEKNYGLKNDRNINKAMNIVASENRYHPIAILQMYQYLLQYFCHPDRHIVSSNDRYFLPQYCFPVIFPFGYP